MTSENNPLQIPYRLETPDDVARAMDRNLLRIGKNYERILQVSKRYGLSFPPAYQAARKEVRKDFFKVREQKIREVNIEYEEIENLNLMTDFAKIESSIPWVKDLADHGDIFSCIRLMSAPVKEWCRIRSYRENPSAMIESYIAVKRLLKQELLSYTRSRKTKSITLDDLRRLIAAFAVYDKDNRDVLEAIRIGAKGASETREILYQNALAELLFARIPSLMSRLIVLEPDTIRQKVFSKIAKFDITPKQRLGLYSYFPRGLPREDVVPVLQKMSRVASRMITMKDDAKRRFHDYVKVLTENIESRQGMYARLFLEKELETVRKLYVPRDVMKYRISYKDIIRSTYTETTSIMFYPTKDYMDLWHGKFSSDCVGLDLGQKHLMTPNFFNVRIFQDGEWIGNIYMLDFTDRGILMVDRIQIPRTIHAGYTEFFKSLAEVFQEMFAEVPYTEILMPFTISNHDKIQKVFNRYKDTLSKRWVYFDVSPWYYFESIARQGARDYCVLCSKA